MTPATPPDPRDVHVPDDHADELVSAVLDGEAADADAARVAAEPALAGRLDRLRAAAAEVGALDDAAVGVLAAELDEGRRESSLAAALAAWDEQGLSGTVARLDQARERRTWARRIPALAAAAAAVAAVALVAGGAIGSGDDDELARDATETELHNGADTAAEGGGGTADQEAQAETPLSTLAGAAESGPAAGPAFADEAALVEYIRRQLADPEGQRRLTPRLDDHSCAAEQPDDVAYEEPVSLRGRPLLARVLRDDAAVILLDPNDCSVIAAVEL